jgi:hypothetical protein
MHIKYLFDLLASFESSSVEEEEDDDDDDNEDVNLQQEENKLKKLLQHLFLAFSLTNGNSSVISSR